MEHRLKTLPAYFEEIAAGRKSFEVRKDDREPPYCSGDTLLLEEFAEGSHFTGRWVRANVGYVLRGEYCKDGYCIMSITMTGRHGFAPPTRADSLRAMSDEGIPEELCALCELQSRTAEDDKAREEGRLVVLPCKPNETFLHRNYDTGALELNIALHDFDGKTSELPWEEIDRCAYWE